MTPSPYPTAPQRTSIRVVFTSDRRVLSVLFAVVISVTLAGPVGAGEPASGDPVADPADGAILAQAELDLVSLLNRHRVDVGLIGLPADPDLMAIACDRAEVMAANDLMSHTEPDGRKVWDRLNDAQITWYGAGEIIVWNNWPAEYSPAGAFQAWVGSPGHYAIMVSRDYNYVGLGAAISATGRRYYAGLFVKEPDETGARARITSVSKRSVDRLHARVT